MIDLPEPTAFRIEGLKPGEQPMLSVSFKLDPSDQRLEQLLSLLFEKKAK